MTRSFGEIRPNTCYWPMDEIMIDEISGRLPPFDGLSERQLRSEQVSKLDDRSEFKRASALRPHIRMQRSTFSNALNRARN